MNEQELKTKLSAPVPRQFMSERQGAGNQTLHYVAGDYVIHTLNDVFGPHNVSTYIDEIRTIVNRETMRKVSGGQRKNAEGKYEKLPDLDVPYLEVQYMVHGRVEIVYNGRTIVRSGVGTGKGSGWCAQDKLIAQIHEVAIKGAETDMVKRAAKKLGPLFGLSIGPDGKQLYASVAEDEATPVDETDETKETKETEAGRAKAEAPKTSDTGTAPAAPKSAAAPAASAPATEAKPTGGQANRPAATAEAKPNLTPAKPAAPAPTEPAAAAQASKPAPEAAAAPAASQAPAEAKSVTFNRVDAGSGQPAQPAGTNGHASHAAPAGSIQLPRIDPAAMTQMTSQEWVTRMKELRGILETVRTTADFLAIAHQTGHYLRYITDDKLLDEGFKQQVRDLMQNYMAKHQAQHSNVIDKIDIDAAVASTFNPPSTVDEFAPPF